MIRIVIQEIEDGSLKVEALSDKAAASDDGLKALGMLNVALWSFLSGRWGVKDAEGLCHGYGDSFAIYRDALQRGVMSAAGLGSAQGKTAEVGK